MAQLQVNIEFLNGAGHVEINIVPLDGTTKSLEHSGSVSYSLDSGSYSVTLDGVSPAGGSTNVSMSLDGQDAGSFSISEGVFSEHREISI